VNLLVWLTKEKRWIAKIRHQCYIEFPAMVDQQMGQLTLDTPLDGTVDLFIEPTDAITYRPADEATREKVVICSRRQQQGSQHLLTCQSCGC
jgi:hypothetical protein